MSKIAVTTTPVGIVSVDVNQDKLPDQVEIVKVHVYESDPWPTSPPIKRGPLVKESPNIETILRDDTYLTVGSIRINQGNNLYKDIKDVDAFPPLKKGDAYRIPITHESLGTVKSFFHTSSFSWHVQSSSVNFFNKRGAKKVCENLGIFFGAYLEDPSSALTPLRFQEVGIRICVAGKGADNIRLVP